MSLGSSSTATVCVHEDRAHCLTGAKLAVLSLRDVSPGLRVVVSCPNPPAAFAAWVGRQDGVTHVSYPETQNCSWNVKPTVLLKLLSEGYENVLWADSDIVVHSAGRGDCAVHGAGGVAPTERIRSISAGLPEHSPALEEMPLALVDSAVRRLRLNSARYPIHEEFRLRVSPLGRRRG